jgi:ubiquinone/menaquinone biosynthesis C-methylase UbiE
MGFYSSVVFPFLVERLMSADNFSQVRARLLSHAYGETLEIGFGTGLNIPHYSDRVDHLTAIDPNPGMNRLALRRIARAAVPVRSERVDGQSLPFDDETFDCVVSTWTLCSIPDVDAALREVWRVLKPHGRLYFAEHGLGPAPMVQKWQNRLTPIQKVIGDGCHLNRDIRALIETAGFAILDLENFYMERVPRIGGYLYVGSATRSAATLSATPSRMMRSISSRSDTEGSPHSSR